MNRLNIADNIVRLRHNKKITQEQLAEFIGVTKASVSKWENNQTTPDISILPLLATFFEVTIDELIGYMPYLSKEQIQRLYQRFAKDFSERPFKEVMNETQDYVKRYHSCYPFLLQICILWLNHSEMAGDEEKKKEFLLQIDNLCRHIKENCSDMRIYGNTIVIQSLVHFQIGCTPEMTDELEEYCVSNRFGNQAGVLLAQAYAMLGDKEKADAYAQVGMYDNVTSLVTNATSSLWINSKKLSMCEETIRRIERVAETYRLSELNPNLMLSFEYQVVLCYLEHSENLKAIEHIDKYILNLCNLLSKTDMDLNGDAYFDKIEAWYDSEFDNGTNAPRSRKVVLENAKKSLDAPPFTVLNGIPEFERQKGKLKELI